jgi:YD repeat-containing protein
VILAIIAPLECFKIQRNTSGLVFAAKVQNQSKSSENKRKDRKPLSFQSFGGENKGDIFVLSGWAKGHSVPLSDSSRQFALKITFNHTDGSTNTATISFSSTYDASNEWQYAAGRAVAGEAYSSVKIELVYNYNANDVYFDGIQLFKEEFGERYYYDQDGNLITATDALGQETHYTYSNNDLVKVVDPSGLTTQYTYDNHNVTRSLQSYIDGNTTVNLASYSYSYDNYGNQHRAYSEIDGVVKQTYTSYSSDKNHIATTTDELGNVTTYEYDLQTSVLLSVKHPKDTDATKTTYEYDVMYRLVKTSATTDQNKTMSATYTYSEDLLTKIAAGSTVYNFTYGDFGLRTKVSVGSSALAN